MEQDPRPHQPWASNSLFSAGESVATAGIWPGSALGARAVAGPEDARWRCCSSTPTADGILLSAVGRAAKVWDATKQQPSQVGPRGPSVGSPVLAALSVCLQFR